MDCKTVLKQEKSKVKANFNKKLDSSMKNNGVLFDDQNILNQKLNKMFGQWLEADCCDTN